MKLIIHKVSEAKAIAAMRNFLATYDRDAFGSEQEEIDMMNRVASLAYLAVTETKEDVCQPQ